MSDQVTTSAAPHPYPGKLIIVEGIDGSGKSTQLLLLHKWLESKGHKVFFTEWNSSELVKDTTKRGKKNKSLTPTTFSLLHATDFASRLYHEILPPLKAGMLVLADRYIYTLMVRDIVRGAEPGWVESIYSMAPVPDAVARRKIFEVHLGKMPLEDDVNIDELVSLTEQYTGADIAAVTRKAGRMALRENMQSETVGQKHFLAAIQEIGPSVTPDTMKYYAKLGTELRKKASRVVERGGEMYA